MSFKAFHLQYLFLKMSEQAKCPLNTKVYGENSPEQKHEIIVLI